MTRARSKGGSAPTDSRERRTPSVSHPVKYVDEHFAPAGWNFKLPTGANGALRARIAPWTGEREMKLNSADRNYGPFAAPWVEVYIIIKIYENWQ